ncbi:MAG: tetratricopeptide repeat protein [Nitrospiraceae bacterium]|nr:tetratricopeptide repeat protein [Nitrospiraceae bacterium]
MTPASNKGSLLIMLLWAAMLVVLGAFTVAVNIAMARYAERERERRPETYIALAEAAMNEHDYGAALRHWEQARLRGPEDPFVYKVLGDIHYNLQHWKEALKAYKTSIELGSDAQGVRMNALWSMVELKRYTEALEFGKLCIDDGIIDPDLYRRTAEACFRGGMFEEAIPLYEMAMETYGDDLYLMEHLRQAYEQVGRTQDAARLSKQIVQLESALRTPREDVQ